MGEQHLDLVVWLRAPETRLHRQGLDLVAIVVQAPAAAGVGQVGLPDVAEDDLLAEPEALDRGVAAHAGALPPAEQEAQRRDRRMFPRLICCHAVLPGSP